MVLFVVPRTEREKDPKKSVFAFAEDLVDSPTFNAFVGVKMDGGRVKLDEDNAPDWFLRHAHFSRFLGRPFARGKYPRKKKGRLAAVNDNYGGALDRLDEIIERGEPMFRTFDGNWLFRSEVGGEHNFLKAIYLPPFAEEEYLSGSAKEIQDKLDTLTFDEEQLQVVGQLWSNFMNIDGSLDDDMYQEQCKMLRENLDEDGKIDVDPHVAGNELTEEDLNRLCGGIIKKKTPWLGDAIMDVVGKELTYGGKKNMFVSSLAFKRITTLIDKGDALGAMKAADRMASRERKTKMLGENYAFSRVFGFVHLGGCHWGAFAIDRRPTTEAVFVDSYGDPPSETVVNAMCLLQRSFLEHKSKKSPVYRIQSSKYVGQKDGYTCGYFSIWEGLVFAQGCQRFMDPVFYVAKVSLEEMQRSKMYIVNLITQVYERAKQIGK